MGDQREGEESWRKRARAELGDDALLEPLPRQGVSLQPLYTARDLEGVAYLDSMPGESPYLRGPRASMYRGRPWTLRQYAGFSTAEDTNAFFHQALREGQRGLSVAFDLATHRGYDSDHPRVAGDVGKAGVAVDSVEDMKRLFAGIDLSSVSVSMTMNGAVVPVLAAFVVAAEESGVARRQLSGTIQNDILKEFMVRNTYIYPPGPSMHIVADIIEFTSREMPKFNSVSISGYHMQEAGATAVQELAFTIADGLEYVRLATERGLPVDQFAPRLSFFFGIGMSFFVEIAKLRAARVLWAELMQERYRPSDPRSSMLRTHCQTSGVSLTAKQPLNNVVRTAIEALAAVLGGTQSLHTNAWDEAIALPSDQAARVARATQLILQHETGIPEVIDPLGGSYFVERLTADLVEQARTLIEEIDRRGGMTRAVAEGFPQRLIDEAAIERQARIDRGQEVVVGVNRYASAEEASLEARVIDDQRVRAEQLARLDAVRRERDADVVAGALQRLEQGAAQGGNLLELAVEAMRARATVGEVSAALERVFGRYEQPLRGLAGVYGRRVAEDAGFQATQRRVAEFAATEGRPPRILIAKLGQDGHDRGAKLIATGLADAGFDVDLGPLFATPAEVARTALDNDVHLVGISTQAGAHLTLLPELVRALRTEAGDQAPLVVCGGIVPQEHRPLLLDAGVAALFEPGTPMVTIAGELLELLVARKPTAHDAR
jgi:methylmalonyl-CoA mutase